MNKKHLSKRNSFKSGFGIFLFACIFIIPMVLYWSLEKQNMQLSIFIFAFIVVSRIVIVFLD